MAKRSNVHKANRELEAKSVQERVTDPICGKKFNRSDCKHSIYIQEKSFHFCSKECRSKFERHWRKAGSAP